MTNANAWHTAFPCSGLKKNDVTHQCCYCMESGPATVDVLMRNMKKIKALHFILFTQHPFTDRLSGQLRCPIFLEREDLYKFFHPVFFILLVIGLQLFSLC